MGSDDAENKDGEGWCEVRITTTGEKLHVSVASKRVENKVAKAGEGRCECSHDEPQEMWRKKGAGLL